jgi:hypothetical protein
MSTSDWRSIRCTRTGSCPFSIRGKPVPQVVEPKARTILCNHSGGRGGISNAVLHDHAAEPACLPWSLGDDGKKKSASWCLLRPPLSYEATLVIGRHFHRSFGPVACEPAADSVTFSLPGSHCWSAYDAALPTRKFSSTCVSISLFAKVLNVASYHGRSTEAVSKSMSLAWPRTLD